MNEESLKIRVFAESYYWLYAGAGDSFRLPGATVATLLMLGVLHGHHIYEDLKVHLDEFHSTCQ